ncbi:hypothetical protein F443_18036 [Phytophthora nicotianae P1569]|uniref:Uncharacterized protein n=3 Tax=Phytophthora nicotianae TaxID=4792 RepID=V9E990_PHYNI|nr:hypothetical protein F443_18036 [Phytophthora nicotianae P1569]ETO64382.1 hypothetical protein F444_18059 [Phytophthora nicotianae P1976]
MPHPTNKGKRSRRRWSTCEVGLGWRECGVLHRVQNYLDTHYSSVRVVACLRSGVGVLLWKNWLVKKRESRLNRVRFGKR